MGGGGGIGILCLKVQVWNPGPGRPPVKKDEEALHEEERKLKRTLTASATTYKSESNEMHMSALLFLSVLYCGCFVSQRSNNMSHDRELPLTTIGHQEYGIRK